MYQGMNQQKKNAKSQKCHCPNEPNLLNISVVAKRISGIFSIEKVHGELSSQRLEKQQNIHMKKYRAREICLFGQTMRVYVV